MAETANRTSKGLVAVVLDSGACGTCSKTSKGTWDLSLFFALRNSAKVPIRITNINAEIDPRLVPSTAPLTIGTKEVVDLRAKDALLLKNEYFDLIPGEEQSIRALLDVVKWFRVPSNRVDGTCALFFSLSVEYRVAATGETLRDRIPLFYLMETSSEPGQSNGSLLCITLHNIDPLMAANRDQKALFQLLSALRAYLEQRCAHTELIWADGALADRQARPIAVSTMKEHG